MKLIRTEDAVGHVLCHDMTQIIKDQYKDARFRKGHIVTEADIPVLLSMGKEHLYVWEMTPGMVHENDAAERLLALCGQENMTRSEIKEGKIELTAEIDGLFLADTARLKAVNSLGRMMIATRSSGVPVKKGDKLCGTRIIPLVIEKEAMAKAKEVAGDTPLLQLKPFRPRKYGVVTTGSEVFHGRITDKFTPVIEQKLTAYGCEMVAHEICDDDDKGITAAINKMLADGVEMVVCTGGMSVDPDDRTPLAIRNTGANIVSYGAPVLPGAMFLVSYMPDGRPVCGLPGCVMYAKRTIFDICLPYLLADEPITADYLAGLGNGGLCLNCPVCVWPNCGFGK